jgi:hypothetical protein
MVPHWPVLASLYSIFFNNAVSLTTPPGFDSLAQIQE